MVTLLVFFVLLLALIAILALIATFIHTAMILLPWTIPAIGLGALVGYAVGLKAPLSAASRPLVGGFVTLVMVMGLGYAGLAIAAPKVPPPKPADLFPTKDGDLAEMTPVHMGISAVIGAVGVAIAMGRSKKEKRLVLELDESPA